MRSLISISIILFLTACSPRVFETETKAFQQGVVGTQEAWVLAWDKTDALVQAEQDSRRVRENWAFDVVDCGPLIFHGSALPVAEIARKEMIKKREAALAACQLIQNRSDAKQVQLTVAPVADRQLLPAIQAITAYANGLAALTAAPDEAAFRTAAADMAASLTKVGEKLTKVGSSDFDVSGPISALTSVFGELALAGLEARKFRTLRRIVREVDPSIQAVTTKLGLQETTIRQRLLLGQNKAVQDSANELFALRKTAPRAERASLQQEVIDRLAEYKAYAATLSSGGISYRAVGAAHSALLDAVQNPDKFEYSKRAFERLKELGEAAQDAKDALEL